MNCLERYETVQTFDDLLQVNVDFLENKMDQTYYYYGSFGEEGGDGEDHAAQRRSHLVDLHHKHRLYTINGQINIDLPCEYQLSYLDFIVEEDLGVKLKPYLLNHPQLYTAVYHRKKLQEDTYPTTRFVLTAYRESSEDEWTGYSTWQRHINFGNDICTPYENINNILKDCYVFVLCVRDLTIQRESDEIVREILEQL